MLWWSAESVCGLSCCQREFLLLPRILTDKVSVLPGEWNMFNQVSSQWALPGFMFCCKGWHHYPLCRSQCWQCKRSYDFSSQVTHFKAEVGKIGWEQAKWWKYIYLKNIPLPSCYTFLQSFFLFVCFFHHVPLLAVSSSHWFLSFHESKQRQVFT